MYSLAKRVLVLFSLLAVVAACGGEDTNTPLPDVGGTDVEADGSGDVVECTFEEGEAPVQGDICDCEGDSFEGRVDLCDRTCECEFGFWACEEDCEEPPALEIHLSENPQLDEQTGNGDTEINPGEIWTVTGTVRALNTPDEGTDVTLRIASSSIFVEVADAVTFEGLDETPQDYSMAFTVDDQAGSSDVEITVEAFSSFTSVDELVEFEIVEPEVAALAFDDLALFTEAGSPAVRINAGDTLTVSATLSNIGALAAEGVGVSVSTSANSLTTPDDLTVGIIAPGESTDVQFTVEVSESPSNLNPRLTLGATSTNAATITAGIDVPIIAPDTLELVGHAWEAVGGSTTEYELVITMENSGSFPLTGLTWTRRNYESSPEECAIEGAPCFVSLGLGEPNGPETISAASTVEVRMAMTISGDFPSEGLVILFVEGDSVDEQFSRLLEDVPAAP